MNGRHSDLRHSVASIHNTGSCLDVRWQDGHISRFHAVWLRNACQCAACGSWTNAMRTLRLVDIPDDITIREVRIGDGVIEITFSHDGHRTILAAEWLRLHGPSPDERDGRSWRPILWDKGLGNALPEADFEACRNSHNARLAMLETLRDYGFVLVRNASSEPENTRLIAELAGPLRVTNYGGIYDFVYRTDPLVYGDLNQELEPHTDEPYRQTPPSVTLFHFVKAAAHGGETLLVDGFRVASALRESSREAFDILARTPVTFCRELGKQGRHFRMRTPVFSLDDDGDITAIRYLHRAMEPADIAETEIVPFYRALRRLQEQVFDPDHRIIIPMKAGDAVFFNNQRVLHGRTGFAKGSDRHMRSCHVELDEFNSLLRTLAAAAGSDTAHMHLTMGGHA